MLLQKSRDILIGPLYVLPQPPVSPDSGVMVGYITLLFSNTQLSEATEFLLSLLFENPASDGLSTSL